jgi:hypothetical protein
MKQNFEQGIVSWILKTVQLVSQGVDLNKFKKLNAQKLWVQMGFQ